MALYLSHFIFFLLFRVAQCHEQKCAWPFAWLQNRHENYERFYNPRSNMTTVPSISRLPKTIERTFYPSTKITVKGNEKNLQAYVITHLNTRKFEYKLFSIFQRKKERKDKEKNKQFPLIIIIIIKKLLIWKYKKLW